MALWSKQNRTPPDDSLVSIRDAVEIAMLPNNIRGTFFSFHGLDANEEHFAIALGDLPSDGCPLVRVHSECITGDLFGSARCDCGPQLHESIERIHREGGFLLYLRQEGRGIGLFAKLAAYRLQDLGFDTYEANQLLHLPEDLRDFTVAAKMLEALGQSEVRLLTNNLTKVEALTAYGIRVRERLPTGLYLNRHNKRYIQAKIKKAHHQFNIKTEGWL